MKKLSGIVFILVFIFAAIYWFAPSDKLFDIAVSAERNLAGLSAKTVNINDGEVAYLEGGKGQTLVLLHGFGANKDNWNRLAMHLASDYHIIAIDLPGFGDSFKNIAFSHDVPAQVQWVNDVVTALNLAQFHMAGNSMGGYIAGNYAATFPDKLLSLWLIDPLGVASAPNSEMFEMINQQQRPVILANSKAEYETLLSYVFHELPFMPDFVISALALQAQNDFTLHSKILADIHQLSNSHSGNSVSFTSPLDKVLANIALPVLITWGAQDRVLHPEGAKRLAAVIPIVKVNLMDNIGHLPMIEAPSDTAEQFQLFNNNQM